MPRRVTFAVWLCVVVCLAMPVHGQDPGGQRGGRGVPPAPRPDNEQSLAHIAAARAIAGTDPFLLNPYSFFCIPANTRANNPSAPELAPVKLFDNVYAVGNSETTLYVIATSDGLLMFDSGYADRTESVVVAGLRTLGLDPANVKYILLGHGHADHFGGARYFQDHYGTQVATSAADWDLIDPPSPPATQTPNTSQARPKREIVLSEGQPFRFGGLTVTPVAIPGHTAGSLAFIFPIRDKGTTRVAGLFGGTILTSNVIATEGLQRYTESIAHYLVTARQLKVEVELQNHPIFDGMADRLARLKTMGARDPNPFIIGTDRYVGMWNIVSECMKAELARRGAPSN